MSSPVRLVTARADAGTVDDVAAGALSDTRTSSPPTSSVQSAVLPSPGTGITPVFGLRAWNYYFLAKLVLFWNGSIDFHPLENLAFAAFLLVPLQSAAWRRARSWIAVPIAAALLYYDSWLPRITRVLSQAALVSGFSLNYLVELIGRFIHWPTVAALVIAWAIYRIVALRVRVGVLVVGMLVVLTVTDRPTRLQEGIGARQTAQAGSHIDNGTGNGDADPDKALQAFYTNEAHRSVAFPKPADADAPFDLIFLHVCSLSWDDLRMMELENQPLLKRLDIVLTRFNSAASYSGPAVIRILRAPCGQSAHTQLYSPAQQSCYLMGSLKQAGFEPNLVLNHDGHFDDLLGVFRNRGGLDAPPMSLEGMPVAQRAFDDSPIYDDLAVLSRWLDRRRENGAPRVAAIYNTISLHDGNHLPGAASKLSSRDTYKTRLAKLLADLDQFLLKLEASGRRAVVALVPEHGGAVRGDKMQVPGLREIPSPAITLVPVGVKVIGPEAGRPPSTLYIDAPTSYLAISHIIAGMLQKSPFGSAGFTPSDYINALPATDFVAENEDMVTMRRGDKYLLRLGKEGWSEYPSPQ